MRYDNCSKILNVLYFSLMGFNDIFILLIVVIVTISGSYVNFYTKRLKTVTLQEIQNDYSLFVFRFFIPLALLGALLFHYIKTGQVSVAPYLLIISYTLVLLGLLLRFFAIYQLGQRFRAHLSIIKEQDLETSGLYKVIRHPSYTGLLVYYFGLGMAMQNYISFIILIIIPFFVVIYRIRIEEAFLLKYYGEKYEKYKSQTYALIPYFY